ncbi:MAG: methyltransferase domain-containing protein [Pseudomonadales bacterium]
MRLIVSLIIISVSLAACQPETTSESTAADSTPDPVNAMPTDSAENAQPVTLQASLAERSEADRARDGGRKPAAVIEFLGITPGMTVVDMFAAAGWYSEVLSHAVGAEGKVYAQNTEFLLTMRDGANDKAMAARLTAGRLGNVERLDRPLTDLGLADGSVDAVMFALNFHDLYNTGGAEAAKLLLMEGYKMLKPGGVFGLIDHVGTADNDNAELHRIETSKVLEVIALTPFSVEAESALLSNPADDHSASVFAPEIRGQTDRLLLRLRK